MSKNHFDDFKNLKNHTSQHDALKTKWILKIMLAYFFAFEYLGIFLIIHYIVKMDNETIPKNPKCFSCEKCDYICFSKKDFNKHLSTRKHTMDKMDKEKIPKIPLTYVCCVCNKTYKYQSGLCKHKKTCANPQQEIVPTDDIHVLTELVKELVSSNYNIVKQNQELQKKVVDLSAKETHNTTNNTTTNNNQKFNINLFLNETCKDAINFSDFIKNIQISYEDLENNAQLGFVNGISKIFLDNLKQLDVNERPIHCTDVKRETMYIKDENTWTKQPDDEKLQKAIQTVSYRSMGKLAEWKNENPDYKDCNSEFSQKCLDIQRQTLAGCDRPVYYPKVIHVLARETIVDK
jgi:hypothetical protein